MSLQYLSNDEGQIVAVQVPIEEWELIKSQYPGVDLVNFTLSNWQKDLIDQRLNAIEKNPKRILPIESLIAELDNKLK